MVSEREVAEAFRGGAAGGDLGAVFQADEQLGVVEGIEGVDEIQVYEVGAVHAHEASGAEAGLEVGEGDVDENFFPRKNTAA